MGKIISEKMKTTKVDNSQLHINIHQIPKSKLKFLLLSFQHVFAMFGANILVPLVINQTIQNAGGDYADFQLIPIQLAFLGSGIGTIIYLFCTGFRVPIYLGSSFAFMSTMGTYYISSGYSTYVSLMLVGVLYVIIATLIKVTKSGHLIKKILPPVVVGPAILMIGLGAIFSGAVNDFGLTMFNNADLVNAGIHMQAGWLFIGIATFTFLTIVVCMLYFKNFLKVLPILIGLISGSVFALIIFGILKASGDNQLAALLFDANGNAHTLLNPDKWEWYPDITHMWSAPQSYNHGFKPETMLALIPLGIVTIAEHVGDHINIGHLTNNDFISKKPGLHRTLLGDGLATIVSVACGGVPNTSYGENTAVISVSKVASVWVIFTAAIFSIIISFLAPISALIQAVPKPVLGGIETILFSMIAVNGLKILIQNKVDMFKLKNIIILSIIFLFSIAGIIGAALRFYDSASFKFEIGGTGLAVLIGIILNVVLPDEKQTTVDFIYPVDLSPTDVMNKVFKNKNKSNKKKNKPVK